MNTLPMKYIFTRQMTAREVMPTPRTSLNQEKSPSMSTRKLILPQLEHYYSIRILTWASFEQSAGLYVFNFQSNNSQFIPYLAADHLQSPDVPKLPSLPRAAQTIRRGDQVSKHVQHFARWRRVRVGQPWSAQLVLPAWTRVRPWHVAYAI